MDILFNYINELINLFNEMSIYLIIGFIVAGLLHLFFPDEIVHKHIGNRGLLSIIKSTLIGIPLPICSCGVVPVATSLRKKGASKGATLSFLISTPQVGADSFMISYSMLGPFFAVFRILAAIITSITAGFLSEVFDDKEEKISNKKVSKDNFNTRLKTLPNYVIFEVFGSIAKYLLIGIFLAAAITTFVPESFINEYLSNRFVSYFLILLISIPLYICATSSTPVAASLVLKGFSPGTAIVFLLAGPATNIVTISTVTSLLGKKSTIIYLFSIILVSVGAGLTLDMLLINIDIAEQIHKHSGLINDNIKHLGSILLVLMFSIYYFKEMLVKLRKKDLKVDDNFKFDVLNVRGMTCSHCEGNVKKAIETVISSEKQFSVNKDSGVVKLEKGENIELIIDSINNAGYEVEQGNIMKNTVITVNGMTCGHCEMSVVKAVKLVVDDNINVVADRAKNIVIINSTEIDKNKVKDSIVDAGFEV